MDNIQVQPLSEALLPSAADVMTTTFLQQEAITTYWLGEYKPRLYKAMRALNHKRMELYMTGGMHEVVATENGAVVGTASLKSPHGKISFWSMLRMLPKVLPQALTYLRQVNRRGLQVARAIRKPANMPKTYYTLDFISVHPDHHGRGIARLLLDHVHAIVDADQQADGVYLITGEDKTRSIYERFGYRVLASHPSGEIDVHHMFRERCQQT